MEWEPIETAPKDEAAILGFADGEMTTVAWNQGYWSLCVPGAYAEDGEWWPTHWMKLPVPPG